MSVLRTSRPGAANRRFLKKDKKNNKPEAGIPVLLTQAGKHLPEARHKWTKQQPTKSVELIKKVHPLPVSPDPLKKTRRSLKNDRIKYRGWGKKKQVVDTTCGSHEKTFMIF